MDGTNTRVKDIKIKPYWASKHVTSHHVRANKDDHVAEHKSPGYVRSLLDLLRSSDYSYNCQIAIGITWLSDIR